LRGSPCFSLALYGIIRIGFIHDHAVLPLATLTSHAPHPNKALRRWVPEYQTTMPPMLQSVPPLRVGSTN
jgi:hypothetical protein